MMAFDAKINNENMTKCLQSLKEMYQDMATKKMSCPGEEEFRQYSVLLKLNDGDILRSAGCFGYVFVLKIELNIHHCSCWIN